MTKLTPKTQSIKTDLTNATPLAFASPSAEDTELLKLIRTTPSRGAKRKSPTPDRDDDDASDSDDKENALRHGRELFGFEQKRKRTRLNEISSQYSNSLSSTAESSPKKASSKAHTPKKTTSLTATPSKYASKTATPLRHVITSKDMDDEEVDTPSKRTRRSADPQTPSHPRTMSSKLPREIKEELLRSKATPTHSRVTRASSAATDTKTPTKDVKTPTRTKRQSEEPETPSSVRRSARLLKKTDVDPHSLGTPAIKRIVRKKQAQKALKTIQDRSSSESEQESSEEDSEIEEEETQEQVSRKWVEATANRQESYLNAIADTKGNKTSDNTLSSLPRLNAQELNEILTQVKDPYASEQRHLVSRHRQLFKQFSFEMSQGFNLLFYGFGSKMALLNEFAEKQLKNGYVVTVNGFFPTVSLRHVLTEIIDHVMGVGSKVSVTNTNACLKAIRKYFSRPTQKHKLYLVIHNIDGESLRHEKTQATLAQLALIPNVHIVASMDHINAPLLWDNLIKAHFRWLWHDLTTFASYDEELSYENSFMLTTLAGDSAAVNVQGALYVIKSLPANTRKMFKELLKWQIGEMKRLNKQNLKQKSKRSRSTDAEGPQVMGLALSEFYRLCHAKFLASSQMQFNTQLVEFRDHHLIQSVMDNKVGEKVMSIPFDLANLEFLLERMD